MPARSWIPLVAAVVIAAVCVRLGLWQLDRLEERQARNATIAEAFRDAPISAEIAARDSVARFQRVRVSGRWDYARETSIASRTRNGSPGVHVITPLIAGDGTVVFVNRGWVYSPDARTVDLSRWHEGEQGEVVGYVDELPSSVRESAAGSLYVVALADSGGSSSGTGDRPARLQAPAFADEGPHLNYAVQWFSFAAIALIGTPLVVRHQRRRRD